MYSNSPCKDPVFTNKYALDFLSEKVGHTVECSAEGVNKVLNSGLSSESVKSTSLLERTRSWVNRRKEIEVEEKCQQALELAIYAQWTKNYDTIIVLIDNIFKPLRREKGGYYMYACMLRNSIENEENRVARLEIEFKEWVNNLVDTCLPQRLLEQKGRDEVVSWYYHQYHSHCITQDHDLNIEAVAISYPEDYKPSWESDDSSSDT